MGIEVRTSTSEGEISSPLPELCVMVKGSTLLKAGRMGRPHFRKFHLSSDLKHLQWESPNKGAAESSVAINDITEVLTGQKTKVFEGNPIPEYEAISFSVMYKQSNTVRSLDIVCKDRTEYDIWTTGLNALLEGFDNVDGIRDLSESVLSRDGSKLSLETSYLFGDRVSVKEDACDVYTWGSSPKGMLGHGEEEEELIPRVVEALLGRDVRKVACADQHTLALSVNGELFAWGSGKGGKLGLGNIQDRYMPLRVGALEDVNVVEVACSEMHSAVVTDSGELYTFGRSGAHLGYKTEGRKQATPKKVEALKDYNIAKVACGVGFTLDPMEQYSKFRMVTPSWTPGAPKRSKPKATPYNALTSEGSLFAFGENDNGQLGRGDYEEVESVEKVKHLEGVTISHISCGSKHAGAVTENGDVWLWGSNEYGQLGTGDLEDRPLPHEAPSTFWSEEIQDIKCGSNHTVVLSCTGVVRCFGDGESGQLGVSLRDTPYLHTPCKVVIPNNEKVVQMDCGEAHTAAVTESGFLYTWGRGTCGRLGHNDHQDRPLPALVESLAYKQVQSIACGADHTAACLIRAWVNDQETKSCMACKQRFTAVRRRHHCRKCGGLFCGSCTEKKCPILEIGYSDPVRVCDRCYHILTESTS